jgi:hypothetical protein
VEFSDEKKIDILINLLKERYESAHKLRERSFKFTLWLLGLGIVFVGLIINKPPFLMIQKILLTAFVSIIVLLGFFFLSSMENDP